MTFGVFCLAVLAYATGLVAPGWLAARLLGWRAAWAWTVAMPLSMLFLLCGVEVFDAVGVPLRLGPMVAWVLVVNAALAFALWKWPPREISPVAPTPPAAPALGERWQNRLLLGGVALLGLLAVTRGFLTPLSGFDTLFRWDFLARQILKEHSLAFYPPLTAADFHVYFHPDGFAPLVSMSFWWIYAVTSLMGPSATEAVMPLAMAQYVGALALAYALAAQLCGNRRAGVLAAGVLAATPMFFRSVMIGQETGLTAIGVAGMMLALLQADGAKDTRALVLAGLLGGGVAGLAREYGPAFGACGTLVLLWRRLGWRTVFIFGGVVALVLLPWHLRNWIRNGNPLYNHGLGLFPSNAVFDAMMQKYRSLLGLGNYNAAAWAALAKEFLADMGWQIVMGIPAAIWLVRRAGWLAGSAAVGGALWLWLALGGLMPGGTAYGARMLSPVALLLAVAAAAGLERVSRGPVRRWLVAGAVFSTLLYAAFYAAIFPYTPAQLGQEKNPERLDWAKYRAAVAAPWQAGMAEQILLSPDLPKLLPPGTRILTENAYAHAILANAGSNYDLVPIWSPEVAFLFDRAMSAAEQQRRLRALKITALLFYPSSPNTKFLVESSPFYATGVRESEPGKITLGWPVLAQVGPVFVICAIPPAD